MRVLVVDNDRSQLETIGRGLLLMGHDVVTTTDPDEAMALLEHVDAVPVDVLLADLSDASSPGHVAVRRARAEHPGLPVVAITGLLLFPNVRTLRQLGVRLLGKPFDPEKLRRVLDGIAPRQPDGRAQCGT
jgi:CheY-like chemotaxis protein